jgi:L-ribulose-5-phosphate 3-epimerase
MTPQNPAEPAAPRFGTSAPKRNSPILCVHSQNMIRVPYAQLGEIAAQLGFEGVDMTVYIGGHVDPRITNVDLVRSFESTRGAGLEVPMISTNITSASDPTCYAVLYLTGHSQVPLCRLGYWPYPSGLPLPQRLRQVRQELAQILGLAQRSAIALMVPNRAGEFVGQSVWDTNIVIQGMDQGMVGYCFDPAEATAEGGLGGWVAALRLALPLLKAVTLQDFYWKKEADSWTIQKCPLGEGMVDWVRFFSMLATAKFAGPISIKVEYNPKDVLGSMTKDLEFARRHVRQAWTTN